MIAVAFAVGTLALIAAFPTVAAPHAALSLLCFALPALILVALYAARRLP